MTRVERLKTKQARYIVRNILATGILALCFPGVSGAEGYVDRHGLLPASPAIDLGVQPLAYPSGVISSVMRRDRTLQKALADGKQTLKTHPFRSGVDMVPLLAERRLEAALLGDMPAITAAATAHVWIVGLAKQASTAIVAKENIRVQDLAGKRIGYVEASSAHHTLLRGLASAGIRETQVTLVPLETDEMPNALERGSIDAFAAWEPAPTIALGKTDKNRIVLRGVSTDYFVIERDFAQRSPQAALQLVAGFLRAIEWMRRSQSNVEKAARWALADSAAFSGKPATISVPQVVSIVRREILDIPSAPVILSNTDAPPLKNEYQFLTELGKLPLGGKWENVEAALTYDGLARVVTEARAFQIYTFDYEE